MVGFRRLNGLTHLIVNKNRIPEIYQKPGFRGLKYLSFEDNLISDWKSFDQINEFESRVGQVRCKGNPLVAEAVDTTGPSTKRVRPVAIARLEFVKKYNGSTIEAEERKECDMFYLKIAFETYLKEIL